MGISSPLAFSRFVTSLSFARFAYSGVAVTFVGCQRNDGKKFLGFAGSSGIRQTVRREDGGELGLGLIKT